MTKIYFMIQLLRIGELQMNEVKVTFSDGTVKTYKKGITYEEISKDYPGKYPYVGVKVDNVIFSLDDVVEENVNIEFIDFLDPVGNKMYKGGIEFILEVSLKELYKDFEIYFLHSHPKGVYAEIIGDRILTDEEGLLRNIMFLKEMP